MRACIVIVLSLLAGCKTAFSDARTDFDAGRFKDAYIKLAKLQESSPKDKDVAALLAQAREAGYQEALGRAQSELQHGRLANAESALQVADEFDTGRPDTATARAQIEARTQELGTQLERCHKEFEVGTLEAAASTLIGVRASVDAAAIGNLVNDEHDLERRLARSWLDCCDKHLESLEMSPAEEALGRARTLDRLGANDVERQKSLVEHSRSALAALERAETSAGSNHFDEAARLARESNANLPGNSVLHTRLVQHCREWLSTMSSRADELKGKRTKPAAREIQSLADMIDQVQGVWKDLGDVPPSGLTAQLRNDAAVQLAELLQDEAIDLLTKAPGTLIHTATEALALSATFEPLGSDMAARYAACQSVQRRVLRASIDITPVFDGDKRVDTRERWMSRLRRSIDERFQDRVQWESGSAKDSRAQSPGTNIEQSDLADGTTLREALGARPEVRIELNIRGECADPTPHRVETVPSERITGTRHNAVYDSARDSLERATTILTHTQTRFDSAQRKFDQASTEKRIADTEWNDSVGNLNSIAQRSQLLSGSRAWNVNQYNGFRQQYDYVYYNWVNNQQKQIRLNQLQAYMNTHAANIDQIDGQQSTLNADYARINQGLPSLENQRVQANSRVESAARDLTSRREELQAAQGDLSSAHQALANTPPEVDVREAYTFQVFETAAHVQLTVDLSTKVSVGGRPAIAARSVKKIVQHSDRYTEGVDPRDANGHRTNPNELRSMPGMIEECITQVESELGTMTTELILETGAATPLAFTPERPPAGASLEQQCCWLAWARNSNAVKPATLDDHQTEVRRVILAQDLHELVR